MKNYLKLVTKNDVENFLKVLSKTNQKWKNISHEKTIFDIELDEYFNEGYIGTLSIYEEQKKDFDKYIVSADETTFKLTHQQKTPAPIDRNKEFKDIPVNIPVLNKEWAEFLKNSKPAETIVLNKQWIAYLLKTYKNEYVKVYAEVRPDIPVKIKSSNKEFDNKVNNKAKNEAKKNFFTLQEVEDMANSEDIDNFVL